MAEAAGINYGSKSTFLLTIGHNPERYDMSVKQTDHRHIVPYRTIPSIVNKTAADCKQNGREDGWNVIQ
jgi:hypothetical protein